MPRAEGAGPAGARAAAASGKFHRLRSGGLGEAPPTSARRRGQRAAGQTPVAGAVRGGGGAPVSCSGLQDPPRAPRKGVLGPPPSTIYDRRGTPPHRPMRGVLGGGGGRTHVCECPLELQTPLLRCPRGPAQPPPVAQLGTGHSSSRCSMLLVLQQHAGAAGAGGGSGPTRMSHGTAWHGGMQQLRGWEHRCPQTNHT